jgi:hypothetical protein
MRPQRTRDAISRKARSNWNSKFVSFLPSFLIATTEHGRGGADECTHFATRDLGACVTAHFIRVHMQLSKKVKAHMQYSGTVGFVLSNGLLVKLSFGQFVVHSMQSVYAQI